MGYWNVKPWYKHRGMDPVKCTLVGARLSQQPLELEQSNFRRVYTSTFIWSGLELRYV